MQTWHITVNGVVQGVGFRPFVHHLGQSCGLRGWVRNNSAGVEMLLAGPAEQLAQFLHRLTHETPPLAHIFEYTYQVVDPAPELPDHLHIETSQTLANGRTLVSPDVATCPACQTELHTPADRRYHYPFINCTHCGPRFTIIQALPYDRPYTTMAGFPLCPACAEEYHTTSDRRFHAQPVACPTCGPHLIWLTGGQRVAGSTDELLAQVAHCLEADGLVALKGLGGFHLVCLAHSAGAVGKLRQLKNRPVKPLAVMVRDLEMAHQLAEISPAEVRLLQAAEAPIVLLRAKNTPSLSLLAPHNAYLGVMLPYTPLHDLLLAHLNTPLVMTSGNSQGAPLWLDEQEVNLPCDGILTHNRPIYRPCDDSLVWLTPAGLPQPLRRSRGYAPLPVLLPPELTLSKPTWAAGADLKNISAVAVDRYVFLSQHIGNLDHPAVRQLQQRTLQDLGQLFQVVPQQIVCDLHPGYVSTKLAQKLAEQYQIPLVQVQHHHAHLAACLAENGYTGRAIGLCFDGTGYGLDGAIWGSEVLVGDCITFSRRFHLQYLPLPGGDSATRHPGRVAFAYLSTLFPGRDLAHLLPAVSATERNLLRQMLDKQLNTWPTSSMGRLFDAVSALLGLCAVATYEGEAAVALETAALQAPAGGQPYPVVLEGEQIYLTELFEALLADQAAGLPAELIAYRFHLTIAALSAAVAQQVRQETGLTVVALSGGVWQNQLLLQLTYPLLQENGFQVLLHHHIPANDGGIAYGQVVVASGKPQVKEERKELLKRGG